MACFDALNIIHFEKKAVYEIHETSQSFGDFQDLNNFDYILIDLDLSPKSKMDGYDIIKKIIHFKLPLENVIILTGLPNLDDELEQRDLPKFKVIKKPITLESLEAAFELHK